MHIVDTQANRFFYINRSGQWHWKISTLLELSWNLIIWRLQDFSAKSLWTPVTVSDQLAFIDTFFLPTFGGTYLLLLPTFNETYLMQVFAGIMTLQFKRLTNPDGNSLNCTLTMFSLLRPFFFIFRFLFFRWSQLVRLSGAVLVPADA